MITKEELEQNGYEVIEGKLFKREFTDTKGRKRIRKELKVIEFKNDLGYICKAYRVFNGIKATTISVVALARHCH
jgi:hypothetical protein